MKTDRFYRLVKVLHHQHLYVKVDALLVGLNDVAPVEKVVVVHHSAREVRLTQHLCLVFFYLFFITS